ncbi:tongue cancer chemotherapy resistance-associated protein 1, partial [Lamprotornis superbus]
FPLSCLEADPAVLGGSSYQLLHGFSWHPGASGKEKPGMAQQHTGAQEQTQLTLGSLLMLMSDTAGEEHVHLSNGSKNPTLHKREMIGSIGVMAFAYVEEKSNCAAEIHWDVLLQNLPGCSDLECIQLVRHLCYQRCISSAFNSIPALSGSCLILLPEIASGGEKKKKKELQMEELFGILGLNIDDDFGVRWIGTFDFEAQWQFLSDHVAAGQERERGSYKAWEQEKWVPCWCVSPDMRAENKNRGQTRLQQLQERPTVRHYAGSHQGLSLPPGDVSSCSVPTSPCAAMATDELKAAVRVKAGVKASEAPAEAPWLLAAHKAALPQGAWLWAGLSWKRAVLAKAIAGDSQQFQFSQQLAKTSAGDGSLAGESSGAGSSPGSLSLLSLISVWGIQGALECCEDSLPRHTPLRIISIPRKLASKSLVSTWSEGMPLSACPMDGEDFQAPGLVNTEPLANTKLQKDDDKQTPCQSSLSADRYSLGPPSSSLSSRSSTMNPVYSPVQPGAPYGNPKNMAYTGYPTGYPTAAPAYNPNMYPTSSPGYAPATLLMKQAWPQTSSSCATEGTFHLPVDTGTENRTYQASSAAFRYTAGTPYKVPPTQSNNAPPPYSPSPNPYQTAMYPIRSAYPQQNLYTQGAYYTQPVYAAQPHVIHHTTVVQPNSIPSAIYPAPVAAPRTNGVAMGMVAGTTMAMSAGTLLTTPQHTAIGAHPVSVPTYRAQGTPTYSYVPPHW